MRFFVNLEFFGAFSSFPPFNLMPLVTYFITFTAQTQPFDFIFTADKALALFVIRITAKASRHRIIPV